MFKAFCLSLPLFFLGMTKSISLMGEELVVYMADPHVRIAQKLYCQINEKNSTDNLQALYDGNIIYEKMGDLQREEVFVVDHSHQQAGQHNLTVRILDQTGQEKSAFSRTWTTQHDGIPIVGIDENNAIRIKGKLIFPVYPATAEVYIDQWIHHGLANTASDMRYLHANFNDYTKEEYKTWLDRCARLGIQNIGPTARWAGMGNIPHGKGNDINIMREYLEYLKDHPGVLMWQWSDEPDSGGEGNRAEPEEIRLWTDLCHQIDTNHPHAVNLGEIGRAHV